MGVEHLPNDRPPDRSAVAPCIGVASGDAILTAVHSLRDGSSPFHDDAEDFASGLEATILHKIERGERGIVDFLLPYIEEEAIARLRFAGVNPGLMHEDYVKKIDWDKWRLYWVDIARGFLKGSQEGPENATATFAAAEVLARSSDLRYAIVAGHAEKASALAMLTLCWVFMGGTSIRFAVADKLASSLTSAQRARAKRPRSKVSTDDGEKKKIDLVKAAMKSAGPSALAPAIMNHLYSLLDELGMNPKENEWGEQKDRSISALDANGKEIKFGYRNVQELAKRVRGRSAQKGRPKSRN